MNNRKKILGFLSLAFLSSSFLSGCNGGGGGGNNPSPSPTPPAPSSKWVSSNFQSFKANSGLTNYNFGTDEIDTNQKLYFLGTNGNSSAIVSFDLSSQTWSNVTYNLANYTDIKFFSSSNHSNNNTSIYVSANNQLYLLGNNSWQQVGSLPNGYFVNDFAFNGSKYTMLATNSNNKDNIAYYVSGTSLTQLASFNLGQYSAKIYADTNSVDWVAYSDSNYVMSANFASVLPLPQVNNGYITSYSNGVFLYANYACSVYGCNAIQGVNPLPTTTSNNPYFFTNSTLSNGNTQVLNTTIGYLSNDTYYTCSFNPTTATASNCNPVAPGVSGLGSMYTKINNTPLSIGITNSFGYYYVNNNQWQRLSPTNVPLSGPQVVGSALSYCPYNPSQSLLYASALDLSSGTPALSYYYADPFGSGWSNFNVPSGGTFSQVGVINTVSGNSITANIYGFQSLQSTNNYLSELYTYRYNQPCSQTYN